ncbi:hypothetical protein V1264_007103 [Littorina saxatilis]|uniref:Uncharacterized protein n=2 Tax=Littorina saxatilis TaxID=31220 RepID=A0AAN9AU55_9CAEN
MTMLAQAAHANIQLHVYDFFSDDTQVDKAVSELSAAKEGDKLHVLIDEACFYDSVDPTTLIEELSARVSDLHIWVTSLLYAKVPSVLQREDMTVPLRSAPVVVREVEQGIAMARSAVLRYTHPVIPAPGDGLEVTRLFHCGVAHPGSSPVDCYRCGQEVADILRRFGVGTRVSLFTNGPSPLSYRDVFILTESDRLRDKAEDPIGRLRSQASDFVRGLRNAGLPVCVRRFRNCSREEMKDTALAITDQITVAQPLAVSGLERKMVVWLRRPAEGEWDDSTCYLDAKDRLFAVSRSSTQLVVVDAPMRHDRSSFNYVGCFVIAIVLAVFLFWFFYYPRFFLCVVGNFSYCEY